MFKNFLDQARFFYKSNDSHKARTFRTNKRIDLVDFLYQPCPVSPECYIGQFRLNDTGDCIVSIDLFTFTARHITVVPVVFEMYGKGVTTNVNAFNRLMVQGCIRFEKELAQIVFDPQTNGGLLVAVPEDESGKLLSVFYRKGVKHARIIGQVKSLEDHTHLIFK